jgi:hypothetical protein
MKLFCSTLNSTIFLTKHFNLLNQPQLKLIIIKLYFQIITIKVIMMPNIPKIFFLFFKINTLKLKTILKKILI